MAIRIPVKKEDFEDGIKQIAAGGLADMFQTGNPESFKVGELDAEEPIAYSEDGETVYITVQGFTPNDAAAPAPVAAAPAPTKRKPRKAAAAVAEKPTGSITVTAPAPKIYRGGKGRPPAFWAKMNEKQKAHYMAETTSDASRLAYMKKFGG